MDRETAQLAVEAALIVAKRTAGRSIMFHGTSNAVLQSILKSGLVPGKSKTWVDDKDTSLHQQSRVSYGGIYYAASFMTALSSTRLAEQKLGGNAPVIVTAILQPKSALPDEDDFNSIAMYAMSDAWGTDPTHEWTIMRQYGDRKNKATRKKYFESTKKWLERKNAWLPFHNDIPQLAKVIDQMYDGVLTRLASHIEGKDWKRAGHEFSLGKQPSTSNGESSYRAAIDTMTRTFRGLVSSDDFGQTFRMMEPVTYGGRNRILSVVELVDHRSRPTDKPRRIVVHYGDPKHMLPEYKKAVGPNYEVVYP